MTPEESFGSWISRAGVVRVRNALNPLLWTMAVAPPIGATTAYFFRDDVVMKYLFTLVAAPPVLTTLVSYVILLFRDPNRLQSEDYMLRHEVLQIMRKRGESSEVVDVSGEALSLDIEKRPQEES